MQIISYSQNREDLFIQSFLHKVKNGFYVDVGAHDPVYDSVTKFFYERGWSGINIEPQSKQFKKLEQDRKEDTNLNIGLSDEPGELILREYPGGGLSTFSDYIKKDYEKDKKMREVGHVDRSIPVSTLREVLGKHAKAKAIHFMKIDVEGLEYEVIKGNDWNKYRPILLCIEANHIVKNWKPLLDKAKYNKVFSDGLNDYYLRNESVSLVKEFSYARLFLNNEVIPYKYYEQISLLYKDLDKLNLKISEKNARISELEHKTAKDVMLHQESIHYNLNGLNSSIMLRVRGRK
jgi:FkbM family methyltransferase